MTPSAQPGRDDDALKDEIMRAIKEHGGTLPLVELPAAVGEDMDRLRPLVWALIREGRMWTRPRGA